MVFPIVGLGVGFMFQDECLYAGGTGSFARKQTQLYRPHLQGVIPTFERGPLFSARKTLGHAPPAPICQPGMKSHLAVCTEVSDEHTETICGRAEQTSATVSSPTHGVDISQACAEPSRATGQYRGLERR